MGRVRQLACGLLCLFTFVGGISAAAPSGAVAALSNLPLAFEPAADNSRFVSRGPGYEVDISAAGATLRRGGMWMSIRLPGANPAPFLKGTDRLPGRSNYFTGAHSSAWRMNIPQYSKVLCREVYPGVDLIYYGRRQRLEYDFVVAPGADPGVIQLQFENARGIRLEGGDLLVRTEAGELRQQRPVIYQQEKGRRRAVAGGYKVLDDRTAAFRLGTYNHTLPLVIDPVISYATFLGGNRMDILMDAAVDAAGNIYVVGGTNSSGLPATSGAAQTAFGGEVVIMPQEGIAIGDGFAAKISPDGSTLLYMTYLGGSLGDMATAVAVDGAGNAYVTGFTQSRNFPVTDGALQIGNQGGRDFSPDFPLNWGDAFVTKLDSNGALVYSTYLGGTGADGAMGIAVDSSGNAYIVGTTTSTDFPVSDGALQRTYGGGGAVASDMPIDFGDGFLVKLNDQGSTILYATYLGGSKSDLFTGVALDGSGAAYVAGTTWSKDFPVTPGSYRAAGGRSDVIVAKVNETGTALLYSSIFGGPDEDDCFGIAVDGGGNAYVAGRTRGPGFPTTPGVYQPQAAASDDAFLAKLNAAGTELVYATYLGGRGAEDCFRPAVDAAGNAYITGDTRSPDFPTTPDAFERRLVGQHNVFVSKFDPSGSTLLYSTLFSGRDDSKAMRVVVDAAGNAYVVGFTSSADFPATAGTAQPKSSGLYDGFAMKISDLGVPAAAANNSPPEERGWQRRPGKFLRWLKSRLSAQ